MAPITGNSNNNVKLCMSYEFDSFEKSSVTVYGN